MCSMAHLVVAACGGSHAHNSCGTTVVWHAAKPGLSAGNTRLTAAGEAVRCEW